MENSEIENDIEAYAPFRYTISMINGTVLDCPMPDLCSHGSLGNPENAAARRARPLP